jgi:ceramide glucosyltransferase
MMHTVRQILEIVALGGTFAAIGYYLLCLWSAWDYLRYRKSAARTVVRPEQQSEPPVSILKPLKGADPEIYETLRSHCLLDDRQYQIVFGVSDADDPAIPLVQLLQQEFPGIPIDLVVCSESLGTNTKVSNLVQMLRVVRHDLVVVSDSDIRVAPDYLRRVVAPLADPKVGLVTCLYRGVANASLGSKLESVGISTDFVAGVLVARMIEGVKFGLGSTLAFRKRELEAIGGFEALVDYLADDYQFGKRIADRGFEVRLSDVVVETYLPAYTLREFFEHQLRWARTVRDSRRGGYLGLPLTFGLLWAVLAVSFSKGAPWAWVLLGVTASLRLWTGLVVGRTVLEDSQVKQLLPLIPLRDLVAVFVWVGSLLGNRISWRGDSFLVKDGRLVRVGNPDRGR